MNIEPSNLNLIDGYRKEFIAWGRKQTYLTADDRSEAFQEAVLIFVKKWQAGQIAFYQCSLKTFLFAVATRVLYNLGRKRKRLLSLEPEVKSLFTSDFTGPDEAESMKLQVHQMLYKLSQNNRRILELYYCEELSIGEIADRLGLSSKNTASSLKSRALKQLRMAV